MCGGVTRSADLIEPETKPAEQGRTSIAHGATLMVAMRAVSRLIGIFSTAILARILTPADFGLVVLGTSVLGVVQLLSDCSLGPALIRTRDPTRGHFDTAWTIALLRGVLVAIVALVSAPYVSASMHEPRVVPILWMLAAITIIQSFENIRLVEFQIDLRFGPVFRYQLVTRIVSFAATLGLALMLRSYWALILSALVTALVTVSYSYVLRPYRPRLTLVAWRDLFGFSKWALVGSFLAVIDVYSINFLIGWFGGARAMGLFQMSSQIAALPASEIAAPIRPPLYAGFARLRDNRTELSRVYIEGFSFLFLVITPMSLGIFATAPMITPLALGPQWPGAPAMIEAIVFYALFDAFGHYPHNLFIVLHRQPRLMVLSAVFLAVRVPVAIYGGWVGGAIGAVYGMAATAVFGAVFWFAASLFLIDVPARALLAGLWRTSIACMVMLAVLLPLRAFWPVERGYGVLALQLVVFVTVGALLHIGAQLLLWQLSGCPAGPETRAIGIVTQAWRRVLRTRLAVL
jgi:lipopolysaccharide exporter